MVKQIKNSDVLDLINNGNTLIVGGFRLSGSPLPNLTKLPCQINRI